MIREGRLIDKKDFTFSVEENDKDEFFKTFFRDYYSNLALEFPDKIVSRELEAIGEKALYEEWLEILAHKKIKISYGKSKQGNELQKLADKNAENLLKNALIKKMVQIQDKTIKMTRGDGVVINLTIYEADGTTPYEPKEGDEVYFTVKPDINNDYFNIQKKFIINENKLTLSLYKSDTIGLNFGTYFYDVRLENGTNIDTILNSGTFILEGGTNNARN